MVIGKLLCVPGEFGPEMLASMLERKEAGVNSRESWIRHASRAVTAIPDNPGNVG